MKDIREQGEGRVGFRVRVQPSSRKDELLGWNAAGELRVRLAARPAEGAANRRLVLFLSAFFDLGKREIILESGPRSRIKTLSAPAGIRGALEELPEI